MYPRFERIKEAVNARAKLFFNMILANKRKITSIYRDMKTNPDQAELLGFKIGKLPTYETIRDFINTRLTDELEEELFYKFVKEIELELKRHGESLGEETGEDATPIRAKRYDCEAEYSGYYKMKGWKKDIVIDLKHKIPIAYSDIEINEDEAKCLIPNLEKIKKMNIRCKMIKVDNGYSDLVNIAHAIMRYNTELHYRIQDNWIIRNDGKFEEIKREYQKNWEDENFRITDDIEYMLRFLYNKGYIEKVGAYYRNQKMEDYKIDPVNNIKKINERSKSEWFNDYVKKHLGFDFILPKKGKRAAFRSTTMCILGILVVALTRIQNGVTKNLGSTVFLTN
jgi:hypothetical protein